MSANPVKEWLWGPYSGLGAAVVIATFVADQAHKWWMIYVYDIAAKGKVVVSPYLDLVLKLNTGISYSLLDMDHYSWQLALAAFALAASLAMWIWIARGATNKLFAVSLGLIIGGALGNGVDRVYLGGVADFFQVHFPWGDSEFYWYVFNIADVAIVAGVVGLLYESWIESRNGAAKPE